MPVLVLIRGLPGSGKTTMAKAYKMLGYAHHEADHYFEGEAGYCFERSKLKEAHAECARRTKESLSKGIDCVVANTFSQMWEIRPYMQLAKEMGILLHIIEAKGAWNNVHGVPEDAIQRMRERWEFVPRTTYDFTYSKKKGE